MRKKAFDLLFLIIFFCAAVVSTATADERPFISEIAEVRARQMGADNLALEISGSALGLPTFYTEQGAAGVLKWQGTGHRKVKPGCVHETMSDLPLAQRLRFTEEDDGLRMEIIGTKPLAFKNVRGMGGSGHIVIELQSIEASNGAAQAKLPSPAAAGMAELYAGSVTLELRNATAHEAFRALAGCAGLNLLFEQPASGQRVSVSFHDMPFQQVCSSLLRTFGLECGVREGMMVVAKPERIGKILGEERTKGYTIAYADIDATAKLIHTLSGLYTAPVPDHRTRQIYITGTETQHRKVGAALAKLDHPGRQVMLEARLVEVNKDAEEELETLISAVYKGWIFSSGADGGSAEYTYANRSKDDWSTIVGDTATGFGKQIAQQVIDPTLKMLDAGLRALETENKGRVLASPSVIALDGERAMIKLTRNYLYQSSVDDKGNAEFTEQETGPTLEITPLIGRDGYITMRLNIKTGEVIGFRKSGASEVPETAKRELETRIRVRDGELFVVGGLYQETRNKSVSRVPVLGYMPLLGGLFTSKQTKDVKSEMAFIVVPHIMDIPYSGAETFDFESEGF